jgi:HEAT repeat protein
MAEEAAKQLKQELEAALDAREARQDEFLSELAATASASREASTEEVASDEEPLLTVLKDKTLPADTREDALQRMSARITRRDHYIEVLLEIVQDRDDDVTVRTVALQLLGSAAFQVARFAPHAQAYEQALRNLVSDEETSVREAAVETLAVRHDPEVQQVLLAGLAGDGPLPVSRERAILLLGEDDHLDNLPWLEELYASGSDDLRQEAVRLMSGYPAGRETLERVLRDKDEATQVRQQSAASLHNLAPERFEEVAKEVATDTSDYAEIRTVSLLTLRHLADSDRVLGDDDFVERLREVGSDDSESTVAEHARALIERSPAEP